MIAKPRDGRYKPKVLVLAGVLSLVVETTSAGSVNLKGVPHIIDGDTINFIGAKVRLGGIDAPESNQLCLDANRKLWTCGKAVRELLIKKAGGRPWTCRVSGRTDRMGRLIGSCDIDGQDIQAWLVSSGSRCPTSAFRARTTEPKRPPVMFALACGAARSLRPGTIGTGTRLPKFWAP